MRKPYAFVLVVCLLSAAAPAGADAELDVVVTIQDPIIVESSGLIARDGDFLTVNDSGDVGQIFVVDGESGETIGRTLWSATARDVEAIAPATGDEIWVGDIGDNKLERPWIEVTRLPVQPGDRAQAGQLFRIAYPRGPRNAEALLVHPVTGRLYVATKVPQEIGHLYEAPKSLDPVTVNDLKPIGKVASLVTDGAFFPDGRHLILRGYAGARVYSFPEMVLVGQVGLPPQEQGEGIAVSADGRDLHQLRGREPAHPPGQAPEVGARGHGGEHSVQFARARLRRRGPRTRAVQRAPTARMVSPCCRGSRGEWSASVSW